jgi:hypothetical protein
VEEASRGTLLAMCHDALVDAAVKPDGSSAGTEREPIEVDPRRPSRLVHADYPSSSQRLTQSADPGSKVPRELNDIIQSWRTAKR